MLKYLSMQVNFIRFFRFYSSLYVRVFQMLHVTIYRYILTIYKENWCIWINISDVRYSTYDLIYSNVFSTILSSVDRADNFSLSKICANW